MTDSQPRPWAANRGLPKPTKANHFQPPEIAENPVFYAVGRTFFSTAPGRKNFYQPPRRPHPQAAAPAGPRITTKQAPLTSPRFQGTGVVEPRGFEPLTSAVQGQRSPG